MESFLLKRHKVIKPLTVQVKLTRSLLLAGGCKRFGAEDEEGKNRFYFKSWILHSTGMVSSKIDLSNLSIDYFYFC